MVKVKKKAHGVGLAAPQIGKSIKIFVADLNEGSKKNEFVAINPIVESVGDKKMLGHKGCLSIKGIREKVKRYKNIKLKYIEQNGNYKEEVFSDWNARIIQHETDHLYGILFVDYLNNPELTKKLEDLAKIE